MLRKLRRWLRPQPTGIHYWEARALKHGLRGVLNLQHTAEQIEAVTQMQKDALYPLLRQQLQGDERVVLDFGCGPGRFTPDLAALIQGQAIGVDPIQRFLDLAPRAASVEYRLMKDGVIPVEDGTIDVIWICLVLGGITNENDLMKTIAELKRVLRPGGLIFMAENTSDKPDVPHWKYRTAAAYQALLGDIARLEILSGYLDGREQISVLAGRSGV